MKAWLGTPFSNLLIVILAITTLPPSRGFSVGTTSPPTRHIKDTKVAVEAKSTSAIYPPPNALPQKVTLTTYMQLPVEQYVMIPMPLGSSLTRINNDDGAGADNDVSSISLDDTEFELIVPTIKFFNMTLQPVVYASVQPRENRVVISSTKCVLRGSPFIEKVKLNDRFDFSVNTTLTWEDSLDQMDLAQDGNQNGDVSHVEDEDKSMDCSITIETQIKVDVDVPRPFSSIPKMLLQRSGNAAVKLTLKFIQGNFVDNLAKDYAKWATESKYRSYRASLSEKNDVKEGDLIVGT